MTVEEFDKGVVQRYLEGPHCPSAWKACKTLAGLAGQAWPVDEFDRDEFTGRHFPTTTAQARRQRGPAGRRETELVAPRALRGLSLRPASA